ncbi:MAG: elongation factor G, partial [Actinomycetota bacterium]|nr:elongation factor G [Actinomycetota bacterium]
ERAKNLGVPGAIYVSKLDRERSSFERTISEIQERLVGNAVPLFLPVGEEQSLKGIVDVISGKTLEFEGARNVREVAMSEELSSRSGEAKEKLTELIAESDDVLLEKYLEEGDLVSDEVQKSLKKCMVEGKLVPVLCGSAALGVGIPQFLDFIMEYCPLPSELSDIEGTKPGTEEKLKIPRKNDSPLTALVFKTMADPYVGRLNYFRVFSGTLKSDSSVFNSTREKVERIGQLYAVTGKEQKPVSELVAGELGSVAKLAETYTGDTLCSKENPVILPTIEYPNPVMSLAVEPKTKGDEDKLSIALSKLQEEDPMLKVSRDREVGQTIISGAGENHLDVIVEKMKRKFGVDVKTEQPKVPYKETITKMVQSEGKYKKQTGGHGQYGHVFIRMEPLPRGTGFEFQDKIVGGVIPRQYIPGVEKGVVAAMNEGFLAGYPIVDVRVTLYDGSFHTVDSSELAFKMAASKALKSGMSQAEPVLIEPIMNVEVIVPEQFMGDVIGDLNSKRGRILGMNPRGKMQVVEAQVPLAEMSRYSIDLRSITGGRGLFSMEFSHYEEVPEHIAQKIIEGSRKSQSES